MSMIITTLYDKNSEVYKDSKLITMYIEGVGHLCNLEGVTKIPFNERSRLWYIELDSGKDRIYSTSAVAFRVIDARKL